MPRVGLPENHCVRRVRLAAAAVVVEGDVELGPVEEGIPRDASEGGSPDA